MPRRSPAHSHTPATANSERYADGLRRTARTFWCASLVLGMAAAAARVVEGSTAVPAADIDRSVIATVKSGAIKQPTIISHIDLTTPFKTVSQWTLVVAQDNAPPPPDSNDGNPVAVCLVKALAPDCSGFAMPFHLLDGRVVFGAAAVACRCSF